MEEMSEQEISDFLAENHVAHLTTVRPDGRPHVTPVSYFMENGKAFVLALANAVKFRNVRRNPKVSLSIATDQRPYKYVLLEGEGRVTDDNLEQVLERMCVRDYPERGRPWARELFAAGGYQVLEVQVQRVLSHSGD